MKLYEYEGKALFARYGIPVPAGTLAREEDLTSWNRYPAMLKPQVLSGGRGKLGAIRVVRDADEARQLVPQLLQSELHGEQTTAVLLEEQVTVVRELYLAITIDRVARRPIVLFSDHGGVDVEQRGSTRLVRLTLNPLLGIHPYVGRTLLAQLGLGQELAPKLWTVLEPLYRIFDELGCELAEINPLALTQDGRLVALDAKLEMDDNAVALNPGSLPDRFRVGTPWEQRAAAFGMSASELGGEILLVTGGAGITMATADLVVDRGGTLAAVVDLQNSIQGSPERAREAMCILRDGPGSVIFFNFYTQVAQLDLMAEAIVSGLADRRARVVARLFGNRSAEGRQLLARHGFVSYQLLEEACEAAVALARTHGGTGGDHH